MIQWAEGFIMSFGKYRGKSLKQIGDDDLPYLDWLIGSMESDEDKEKPSTLFRALSFFMEQDWVESELADQITKAKSARNEFYNDQLDLEDTPF